MTSLIISALLIVATAFTGIVTDIDIYNVGGALVVDYGKPEFQLNGIIWGGFTEHEYGHSLQQQKMGDDAYYARVAIPSVLGNVAVRILYHCGFDALTLSNAYDAFPWEAEATELGKTLGE